jgi:hypothetical protein
MAKGSGRSAAPGSIIGSQHYHLSVPYLRTRLGGSGSRFRRPTAQQLRAGTALGHPRPGGRDDEPAVPRAAKPGTQTDE